MSASAVKVIMEVIAAIGELLFDAFSSDDPRKLEKVTSILPPGHQMKTRAKLAHEEEMLRRALEKSGSS